MKKYQYGDDDTYPPLEKRRRRSRSENTEDNYSKSSSAAHRPKRSATQSKTSTGFYNENKLFEDLGLPTLEEPEEIEEEIVNPNNHCLPENILPFIGTVILFILPFL
jgi:hypothetical protein